jgi:hypothetical protein
MITKQEPYKIANVQQNIQKHRSSQLRNLERRIGSLDLNDQELQKLFTRTSLLSN